MTGTLVALASVLKFFVDDNQIFRSSRV